MFIVATIAAWRICPLVDEGSGSLFWRTGSIATRPAATGGFLLSGSGNWHHRRAEPRDWIPLFSILGWHWAVDQQRVVGVDDWPSWPRFRQPLVGGKPAEGWRRNFRYGTIVCDLERRRTIALLLDREPVTTQAWLAGQAQIEIVARDRGGGYALAAARALPRHAGRGSMASHGECQPRLPECRAQIHAQILQAISAATINPELLTSAERLQYDSYLWRKETNVVISDLAKDGLPIKAAERGTGHSRKLVCDILRGQRTEIFRARQSSIEPYLPWLDEQ